MQRIAIAGATGYIGGRLAPRLLEAGYSLRCLVRSPRKLEGRDWTSDPRVEVWQSDLDDRTWLTRNLSGCDVAFYLVHSMMSSDRAYAEHDLALALTFAAAARDAGVGRIIYLGGLGEMGSGLSEHLQSCRDDRITLLIPQARLDVREAIHAALSQVKAHLVETHWSMAGPMPGDPDWSGGTVFRDVRQIAIALPPRTVFRAVCRVGGEHGWNTSWLWRLRGWLDRRAGGPGLRRGRRHPEFLRYGDALDFWRVVGIEQDRSLSLRAEMKLPGQALLDFRVAPDGESKCTLRQTALFEPRGLAGLLYWYAVAPFHGVVFRTMLAAIQRDAAGIAADREP